MDKSRAAALAADDLAYHDRVVAEEAAARQLLQQAQIRAAKAEAVASSWWAHLKDVYVLVEADTVAPDGTITRVPREPLLPAALERDCDVGDGPHATPFRPAAV